MKTSLTRSLSLVFAFFFAAFTIPSMAQGSEGKADSPSYVGTKMCKMCHKGETRGRQFEIWQASTHASAYDVLGSDKARDIAAKAGVEGNPQESDQCLKCHVTAFGVDAARFGKRFVREEGVQCEACHGPGSKYKSNSVMRDKEMAVKNGLVIPDEKTCTTCHNEKSPTFKGFDFKSYYGKIAHPIPGR